MMARMPGPPDGRKRPSSDAPIDLLKEREAFVRTFLRKGVELTEELLRENEELREDLVQLKADNARLGTAVKSDDAIRDLLATIERLEAEKDQLLERTRRSAAQPPADALHRDEIEQELNDLANLYVASAQLHTSLSARRVVRHLCDTLGQLVGARHFTIYVIDAERGEAVPIATEGQRGSPPAVPLGHGPVGEACVTALSRIRENPSSGETPVAVVPLLADGRPIGAIEVVSLLVQKRSWARVDHELFKLLGSQAGVALIAANLYAGADNSLTAIADLAEKIRGAEGA